MGELYLEVIVDRIMKREFNVEANVGAPQVSYRKAVTSTTAKADYTYSQEAIWRICWQYTFTKLVFEDMDMVSYRWADTPFLGKRPSSLMELNMMLILL